MNQRKPILFASVAGVFIACAFILGSPLRPKSVGTPKQASPPIHQLLDEMATAPPGNWEQRLVADGLLGDGIREHWMDRMRQEGVKTVRIEVYLTWFFGPHLLHPVRTVYYSDYGMQTQVVDEGRLAKFRSSGLEHEVQVAATQFAPHASWVDLPRSIFVPFSAATTVTLFDDEWLPIPPRMFTTFGPGRSPLIAAIGQDDRADIARILSTGELSKAELNEALFYSCSSRDPYLMSNLLKAGADPNVNLTGGEFYTPLMTAVWDGSLDSARTLVAAGAKVTGSQGQGGETPLTSAARGGPETAPILELLLASGADVNAANEFGLTPLMCATHRQPVSSISLLIGRGARIDSRDRQGRTALLFASERGNADAVRILLGAGADANAKAVDGDTPLSVAPNRDVAELLRQGGAR